MRIIKIILKKPVNMDVRALYLLGRLLVVDIPIEVESNDNLFFR